MTLTEETNEKLIGKYAELILKNTQLLLHDGVQLYLDEEPLARYLAESLTEQGWPSKGGHVQYARGSRRADIVTESPDHQLKITNEIKYMVCDWPGVPRPRRAWAGLSGPAAQHLGINPASPLTQWTT